MPETLTSITGDIIHNYELAAAASSSERGYPFMMRGLVEELPLALVTLAVEY
jgi:hypothetical protein